MAKKNKRLDPEPEDQTETKHELGNGSSYMNEEEGEKKKKKKKKRAKEQKDSSGSADGTPTVSVALPGSIIDNTQSFELATRLAGQIARAVTIFRIDEVVVFESNHYPVDDLTVTAGNNSDENESGAAFLIRILRFLETPQYLRKALFPRHNSFRSVGLLPPLDAPHHLRKHEWAPYREGVTLKQKAPSSGCTLVDVGLSKNVVIDQVLEPGTRVTVAMGTDRNLDDQPRQVVSSSKPREELGMYWGYKVRYAANISSVLNCCPYMGGYDHLIGTSEHGIFVKSSELKIPSFRHLLIAFGGLAGLEECIEEDKNMKVLEICYENPLSLSLLSMIFWFHSGFINPKIPTSWDKEFKEKESINKIRSFISFFFQGKNPREIFDSYLNVCPHQGSRTIRTEEAVFISLQYFQEPIDCALQRIRDQGS